MIPYPRLLTSAGAFSRTVTPISVSLSLNITPLSTASMKLPNGESVPARSYVELFSPLGSAGIFRVRSPQDAYGDDITNVELEHAISEVGDYVIKGEIKGMIAANTAMTNVFSHYGGTKWQLGSVSALGSGKVSMNVSYGGVLDAMLEILSQKPSCMMAFDFTTSPWTVKVVTKGTTVAAEGRLSRNVSAARISYDDTELCTRVWYEISSTTDTATKYYPVFTVSKVYSAGEYVRNNSSANKLYILPNGHAKGVTWANTTKTAVTNIPTTIWTHRDADTISTYGVVERTISTSLDYTDAEAQTVADEYLAAHKTPQVSIEISAEELSSITGETLDTFTPGKLMRLALPDYNLTAEQIITSVTWDSVYDAPNDMTVNLAYEEKALSNFMHNLDSTGSGHGSGRGRSKKKEEEQWQEYIADYQHDKYHWDIFAKRLDELNEVTRQAGLYIDSNGVLVYADDVNNGLGAKLKVNADAITAEVTRATENEGTLSSRITQNANSIALKVSKGNVGTQLAVELGNVSISGGNLVVSGYVKSESLSTVDAKIDNLMSGTTIATKLYASTGQFTTARLGTSSGGAVYIYGQQVRIYQVVDTNGTTRNVFGYS